MTDMEMAAWMATAFTDVEEGRPVTRLTHYPPKWWKVALVSLALVFVL